MSGGSERGAEAILSRIEQSSGRSLRAMIEISDRCNEVCVHCYQEQGRKGEMTTAQIKAVMDELAAIGVLVLTLSGGEATLRKDLLELIAHARGCGFAVRLFTNGLTMTRELAHALAELAVHVVEISLYSHRAEVHDFVTGVPGSFDKTVAGIKYLVAERVDVHVKTPVMSVNEHELEPYIDFASALGATYGFDVNDLMPREAEDRSPELFSCSPTTFARVTGDARFGEVPRTQIEKPLSASVCGAGEYLLVEPNGEIRPCTMLHVNLGNATQGLGPDVEAARSELRALHWGEVHGCRICDLRAYCGRCHARSLAEVGDALAPYPTACAKARSVYQLATSVAPQVLPGARREVALGPYRRVSEHVFETAVDVVTAADQALAARLGWTRRQDGGLLAPGATPRPGALVQIRRPGRKRPAPERLPCMAVGRAEEGLPLLEPAHGSIV